MNHPIKSDDKVKGKKSEVLSNLCLTSQDLPKISVPLIKAPSNQNKISDSESKQEPSKKEDDPSKVKCALVANIEILNQPFTVGIIKEGEDICFGGSATFKGFKFQDFIDSCSLDTCSLIPKDYNFIPKCIRDIELSGITVTVIGNIKIPEKSKDNAPEQNKTTNKEIKLETNNEYIKLLTEKPIEENKEDKNKSLHWTLTYGPKKQDQQKNTDNDSEIQVVTENDRGIKVGELISDFAKGVLKPIGLDLDTDSLPEFIKDFTITGFTATNKPPNDSNPSKANQDEPKEEFIDITIDTSLGSVEVQSPAPEEKLQNEIEDNSTKNSDKKTWSITYTTPKDEKGNDLVNIDVLEIPVAGELVKKIDPNIENTTINNFKIEASNKSGVNLSLGCKAFGQDVNLEVPLSKPNADPQQEPKNFMLLKNDNSPKFVFKGTAVWKKFDKPITILILTIPKLGFGLDNNGNIAILLDASLNVSPLTFSLNGAGIGVNLSKLKDINFYLSGFGIGFDNGVLSIAGGLSAGLDENKNPQYSGMISIRFKEVGLTAIGQYTKIITGDKETASLCACFSLLAPIGGIPAFFVRGIAGGFGYNERLILPSIENVNDHFLVQAAMGTHSNNLDDLRKNVNEEDGQYFLAAGLKFTSFELIEGCVLVTASFGNDCELGLLGLADISIPPKAKNSAAPIAYAQLALKASIKPSEGFFSAEAQLTNESYILSKDCKLTGGFAAYAWFGDNEHSGDFVVTLGGYAPSYQKPDHYPTVPRLGINWKVDDHININGEMYFAVTPSNLMAGGKLCATYTQGDLKAWFIAYADILMDWKPFRYDVRIGASVGASYTLDLWLVKKTFSIELSADLHLWGPDLQGTVDISWYIISFTISFGGGNKQEEDLDWNGFINSFFASKEQAKSTNDVCRKELTNDDNDPINKDILSISLDGVIGNTQDDCKGIDIISPYQLAISAISNIPMNKDKNGNDIGCVIVKPVKDKTITPSIEINITDANPNNNFNDKFKKHDFITKKLPSALWIPEKRSNIETVNEFCVGKKISLDVENYLETATNFPINKDLWISIQELAEKNLILKSKCFDINEGQEHELNVDNYTINEFWNNGNDNLKDARIDYVKHIYQGQEQSIDISFAHADTLFSEDFLKTSEKEELKNEQ